MSATITCTACGTVLGVPKGGMPKTGLSCNWCGYVNQPVAAEQPKAVEKAVAASAKAAATKSAGKPAEKIAAQPHRWADDEDDNGLPYEVPPEEVKTRPCEACTKPIDIHSVVCIHCGYNAEVGRKEERTYQPIDREWQSGWPRERRIRFFAVVQVINVITLAINLATDGSLPLSLLSIAFYVALQAFIFGTYESVRIRRNKKGQTEITSTWRVAFIPQATKKLNWREHEGVGFGHYDATSVFDWVMVVVFLPFGIIGAILWWYYVIRSDRFYAALCRDMGYPETYLYRGMDEKKAREIAQIATDATGLPLANPL